MTRLTEAHNIAAKRLPARAAVQKNRRAARYAPRVFARAMYDTLVMPECGQTLLGLMDISGGTYVGFKA